MADGNFVSTRPRRHTSLDRTSRKPGHVARARSTSNILDTSTDDFNRRLYDPILAPHLQRTKPTQTGLGELVDFLKNHAPPADNFMSIPDHDDEKRRWLKWVKKTRSGPKPPPIRLPDTAVSGKTIGGHRHIAITIPFDAFPMGERPRSQYPVYHEGTRVPRTITNDKGVVTVLKTVNESAGESSAWMYGPSRPLPRTPSSRGDRSTFRGGLSAPSSRGQDEPRRPATTQSSDPSFPTRASSRANQTLHQPISIDGLLSRAGHAGTTRRADQSNARNEASSAKVVKVEPTPVVIDAGEADGGDDKNDESRATEKMENPLGSRQSAMPEINRTQSRRDKVRDRKRRDMEALVSSKKKGDEGCSLGQLSFSPIRGIGIEPEDPELEEESTLIASPSTDAYRDEQLNAARDSQLTPPRSPVEKPVALDRTSLHRRREWKETRQARRLSSESRAAVRARAQELIDADAADTSTQALDKEILRLYEAYREHRFNDMEHRVRLLERNGDVWLRALVPVLKGLNARDPSRGYMSEEEMPRARPASVALRRAQSSHRPPSDGGMVRADSEDSVEGTTDGLDTVEPLMRELAGAARARQMRAAGV